MKIFENEFFYDIFLKEKYTNFLKTRSEDLWKGTPFEDYILISQSAKGSYGENIIKDICREKYFLTVERRINEEHDCIINGKKTELKFCLTETKRCDIKGNHIQNDCFHISHLSVDYDWERCIILAINTDNRYLFWFDKDTFIKITNEKKYFTLRKSNRYYLHGKHFLQFMNSEYTKTLIEW